MLNYQSMKILDMFFQMNYCIINVKLFEYSKYSIKELSEKIGYEDIVKYKVLINEIKFASDVE